MKDEQPNTFNEEKEDMSTLEKTMLLEDMLSQIDQIEKGFDDSFKSTSISEKHDYNLDDNYGLEKTQNIDLASLKAASEIEYLKKAKEKLMQEENEEKIESSGMDKGRAKTLLPNGKKPSIKNEQMNEDMNMILNSFYHCFVLAFVTASMGVGWILYLINQITI